MIFNDKIVLDPIGYVRTRAVGEEVKDKSRIAEIVLREDLAEGLEGIEDFSHVFVLFWLNRLTAKEHFVLRVHPRHRADLPLLGVFATRTMLRPNPIGLTLVELVDVEANVLTVKGLDAYNDTPVIDIKPYDTWDTAANAKFPDWWKKMQEEKSKTLQ